VTLRGVLDVVLTDPGMASVVASAGSAELAVTAPPSVQPLVAGALAARSPGAGVPVLVVTAGERDADAVADLLAPLRAAGARSMLVLPIQNLIP
jgi:transcription-repair coupling factor (superfamily II helicase)